MLGWIKHKMESRLLGELSITYADDTTVMAESEESWLKANIQKTKIMASSLITSWKIDGETVERVADFIWAPKSLWMVTSVIKLKHPCSLEEKL